MAKPDCADNKSNNWPDPSPDSEEYSHKININKGESANNWIADNPKDNIVEPNNKYTDYNNDFHIWANKVNNSVKPSSIKSGPTGLIKKVQ